MSNLENELISGLMTAKQNGTEDGLISFLSYAMPLVVDKDVSKDDMQRIYDDWMSLQNMGIKLKELRGSKSIDSVASDCGITKASLMSYENGERMPRDEIKLKLAEYYGASIESIFFAN